MISIGLVIEIKQISKQHTALEEAKYFSGKLK